MKLEATQNNQKSRAGAFKDAQTFAQLSKETPTVHSLFIPEDFNTEYSPKHRLAINELYKKVLNDVHMCGAVCVVDKGGKESFYSLGSDPRMEIRSLGIIENSGSENVGEIYLMSTNSLVNEKLIEDQNLDIEKAKRVLPFMKVEDARPIPPFLSSFIKNMKFEVNIDVPVRYEVLGVQGLWSYSFDPTADFVQRITNGISEDEKELETEYPDLKTVKDFERVILTREYKDNPGEYLGEYMMACRSLGIMLNFEPIEKFV